MSSVLRYIREPTSISKRFTVFPYYGLASYEYYFTVSGETLYRIEDNLKGMHQWVVSRDMGTETAITNIDPEIIEYWENDNSWSNIRIVRNGRARKFQALSIPQGNIPGSANLGPAWNQSAYTTDVGTFNPPYYNVENTGINELMIMGYDQTTVLNNYYENLPFATFYAVIDPIIIKYEHSGSTYTRAIVNRVMQS